MRIRISSIFDRNKLDAKLRDGLETMINYLNELSEQTVRLLNGGLSFQDNFNCEAKTLTVESGIESTVVLTKPYAGYLVIDGGGKTILETRGSNSNSGFKLLLTFKEGGQASVKVIILYS